MHTIVLVGGFGTRLRPLTYTVPKPMLPVGNEPIITRLVRRLEQAGVTTVTLALGFLPDPFKAAFPGDRCGNVELRYAVEPEPLDTAGGIRFAAEFGGVDGTFLALNGDNVTDLDFAELIAAHRRFGGAATLHLTSVEDTSAFGVVETDTDGRVRRFLEKPAPGVTQSTYINAGTYVMETSVLDEITPGVPVNIERVTFPTLAGRGELFGFGTDDYWTGTDRPDLLLRANLDRLAGRFDLDMEHPCSGGRGVDPTADIAEGAVVVDTVVAPGVSVGAGSHVRRSVLLAGSSVGKDVVVEDSVVMGNVPDGAVLAGAVIGADAAIEPGQQVTNERIPAPRPDELAADDTDNDEPAERAPSEVLVIGGGGFIGSHLVDRLVAERVSVDVVDDLSSGSLANLADARNSARLTGAEMRIHTIDAGAPEVGNLISLRRPRQIVHLALLPPGRTAPGDLGRSFSSMLTVLEAARQAAVTKVVVLLPATVMYGQPASRELPIKEIPIVPRGVRGVVAKAIIDLLNVYRERHGIEFTALAASTVFGSRQRPSRGVVATLVHAAAHGEPARLTGDGRQTRDFVFVDDVVDAVMRARQRGSGLVVNVGTGQQTSLRELASLVNSVGPQPTFVAERPDELQRFSVSPVRARIHLGWAPWTSLAEGLATLDATHDPHDR